MTAKGQNLEMFQGDDKIIRVTTLDTDGNAVDISGCTIRWVWYKRSPYNLVMNKTTISGGGVELTDPTSGIFEITLVPDDTESLLGDYNHECELTDLNDKISTIMVGTVKVLISKA